MTDKTDSKEREALRKIGEEQAFEAWFKVDCPVEGANAKIAAKAAWKARASLAASAGSEPVAWQVWWGLGEMRPHWPPFKTQNDAADHASMIKSRTEVRPLYTHPSPSEGMVGGWIALPGALPEPGTPVLLDIGKKYPIRAMWAAKFTLLVGLEDDSGFGEHDERTDEWYCPEGWYEWNEHEETHWRVTETPRAWAPLPPTTSAGSGKGE